MEKIKTWTFFFLFCHIQRLVPVALTSALPAISHFVMVLVQECSLVFGLFFLQEASNTHEDENGAPSIMMEDKYEENED